VEAAPRFEPARDGKTEVRDMARCDVCGNDYDKAFEVRIGGATHTFDSFECAIHALAPSCVHCGCKVIGHGVEANGRIFCCAHCAAHEGVSELRDRV
jgi:Rieske Fe-S protein